MNWLCGRFLKGRDDNRAIRYLQTRGINLLKCPSGSFSLFLVSDRAWFSSPGRNQRGSWNTTLAEVPFTAVPAMNFEFNEISRDWHFSAGLFNLVCERASLASLAAANCVHSFSFIWGHKNSIARCWFKLNNLAVDMMNSVLMLIIFETAFSLLLNKHWGQADEKSKPCCGWNLWFVSWSLVWKKQLPQNVKKYAN